MQISGEANILIITTKNSNTIIDCASSSTKVKEKEYSEQSIRKTCTEIGFVNEIDAYPNTYGVMKASNVNSCNSTSLKKLLTDNDARSSE